MKTVTRVLTGVLTIAALLSASQLAFAGDAAAGKEKAKSCASCHGMNGKSNNPNNPNLAGQKKNYLIKAMKAYKSGARKDAMMNSMMSTLSDEDMENIAEYYSSVK
ncbi:MAG: cytochrome c [Gammaproteobacteria bacterium]